MNASKTWSSVNKGSLCGILLLVVLIIGFVRTWSEFLLEEQLVLAAGNGDMTSVKLLVNIGVDTDCKNVEWGDTPLAAAYTNGHDDVVTYLLEHHADTKGTPYQRK